MVSSLSVELQPLPAPSHTRRLLYLRDQSGLTAIVSVLSPPLNLHPTTGVSPRALHTAPGRSWQRMLVSLTLVAHSSPLPMVRISNAASVLYHKQCSIDAYRAYMVATGAVLDETTGHLRITPDQYGALLPLNFNIGPVRPFCFKRRSCSPSFDHRMFTLSHLTPRSGLVSSIT